ncbi:WD repeat protein [Rhodotorula toruloides]|uniref:WD repeat protein n=1 Tax=Rhodotorula toruloides TaxID=5286 RepID=A0A511KJI0_RHOTO|nr:WD repeat protein [Rhodotorula toruloides]
MQPSSSLVRPNPYSVRVTTTSSHPQLRDLLVFTPEAGNAVTTVCYDSLCSVDLYAARPPEYTPLRFSPSTLAYGMGLVVAGGQSSELAIRSAQPGSDWCHQYLPSSSVPSATGVRTIHSGCINNSICVTPSPNSPDTPRLLVSSNDELIKVYEVEGRVPDYKAAKRRRERERKAGWSVVEATWAAERGELEYGLADEEMKDEDSTVEEQPSYDEGSSCHIIPIPSQDLRLPTAVNHCSVSPDGKCMVAVGDTSDVFLYDCRRGRYELAQTFKASNDASFSTDWSDDGLTFAVASQDGFVHVYDIRNLPSSSRPPSPTLRGASANPRKLAELKTTQAGPAGAARKVKFSPGGKRIDGGLLAFTEHRNRLHIVDARTFETYQIIDIPTSSPSISSYPHILSAAPPLRPRPQPPPRAYRRFRPSLSRIPSPFSSLASFSASGGSGTHTPRDEKERDDFEREMRERTERRLRDEERRTRDAAREFRRQRRLQRERLLADDGDGLGEGGRGGDGEEGDEMEVDPFEESDGMRRAEEHDEHDEERSDGEDDGHREEEEEEDEDDSASSVNTTRPHRFAPATGASDSAAASRTLPNSSFSPFGGSTTNVSLTSDEPPVRRNFSGYTPLNPNSSGPARIPTYASPPQPSISPSGRIGTSSSFYYSTYVPTSYPSATFSFATSAPAPSLPITSLFAAPLVGTGGTYHATSAFFPLDSTPGDLLGLAFDEFGERIFVATGERVWEWEVDARARRGSAAWGTL